MARRLFIGTTPAKDCGWMMCHCGSANQDGEGDYVITTNSLKADEVPDPCNDAKTFSQFVAGLLNAFYNGVDATKFTIDQIIDTGVAPEVKNIPHPDNTEIPF